MATLAAGAQYVPAVLGGIGAVKEFRAKPKKQPAIPMPDEEMIRKSQKRIAGQRRTGRASTILTETDRLGG